MGQDSKTILTFQFRRTHEEICPFRPVQCPEFDCNTAKLIGEMLMHFQLEHSHHFVNARGNMFKGDIRQVKLTGFITVVFEK
jgi:hypothetical protein